MKAIMLLIGEFQVLPVSLLLVFNGGRGTGGGSIGERRMEFDGGSEKGGG